MWVVSEYMNFVNVPVIGTVPRPRYNITELNPFHAHHHYFSYNSPSRHAHAMCIANGSLWVFGGYSEGFTYLNDLYTFDFGILYFPPFFDLFCNKNLLY